MSQENIELVRRNWDAFAEGVIDEPALKTLHSEVELIGAVGGIEEGAVTRGRDAVRDAVLVDSEVWAERRLDLQRVIDAGDRVVALLSEYRRGQGSGVEVRADIALVYGFKDGLIIRIEPYMSQAEALAAVGLSEQAI